MASPRTDELGRLSRAVQRMAARLGDYASVSGQKCFLGDIAHELCSPLVRLRMSLGILEERLPADQQARLETVNEEVEELSQVVNERLDFSKASLNPRALPRVSLALADCLAGLARREAPGVEVALRVEDDLAMDTNPDLLKRAVGNALRNAVRLLPRRWGDRTAGCPAG